MKNGLVPRSKNDKCDFPDRVYLMMDERNGEVSTNSALRELAIMLMSAFEKTESNEYVDDYKWSLYRIDISKLSNEIQFSFDENFYPLAVFTPDNIPPSAIYFVKVFDFSYRKPGYSDNQNK